MSSDPKLSELLWNHYACARARRWVRDQERRGKTPEEIWKSRNNVSDIGWVVGKIEEDHTRRRRLRSRRMFMREVLKKFDPMWRQHCRKHAKLLGLGQRSVPVAYAEDAVSVVLKTKVALGWPLGMDPMSMVLHRLSSMYEAASEADASPYTDYAWKVHSHMVILPPKVSEAFVCEILTRVYTHEDMIVSLRRPPGRVR